MALQLCVDLFLLLTGIFLVVVIIRLFCTVQANKHTALSSGFHHIPDLK